MSKLVEMLRTQSGRLSVARICTVVTFILWIGTWIYTLILGKSYAHFETVSVCMLIEMLVVLCSKAVDSKILSVKEESKK